MADVAVIVPVTGRPQNAEPFMFHLHNSLHGLARTATAYAVCDVGDDGSTEAWRAAGAEVLVRARRDKRPGTFAEKVNHAYRRTNEPWLFLTGDDVKFHLGWLDAALQVAEHTGGQVVGTNDLGNARVYAGEHATHMLIARSYVDEKGASWDGPGVVAHEGYRHWYVDDEIVTAAKQRGTWAPALGAVVEHMHPAFGKAPNDYVYLLGQSQADRDEELFKKRLADHS